MYNAALTISYLADVWLSSARYEDKVERPQHMSWIPTEYLWCCRAK